MYTEFFHLRQAPFSIAPDPRYLFMSRRHREALAHLLYGVEGGGGFVLLTGEIGAGKTTVCRCLLEQVPDDSKIAYIFNPKLSAVELLQSVCHEFSIPIAIQPQSPLAPGVATPGVKNYVDALNLYLLEEHAQGRNSVLIIDEAQNLSLDVLEQLRLLTNLETSSRKLLQIILIGQPELRAMLARPELEQLAQRTIARYHLDALSESETAEYIVHRLAVGGLSGATPFRPAAMKLIHKITRGIPRRINLLCDRCLLGAYAGNSQLVDPRIVRQAAVEIFGPANAHYAATRTPRRLARWGIIIIGVACGVAAGTLAASTYWHTRSAAAPAAAVAAQVDAPGRTALVDLTDAFPTMAEDETSVYRELVQMWGLNVAQQDPCTVAQSSGLQCYASNGGFSELQVLDRPAILKLIDPAGKARFALLTDLSAQAATLRVGQASYSVHPTILARHFRGSFATLWSAPPEFSGKISLGDRGLAVDWLAASLTAQDGAETQDARGAGLAFGQALVGRLKNFQIAQGLRPDGIAGPRTMMLLNRALGVEEPRLQKHSVGYGQ